MSVIMSSPELISTLADYLETLSIASYEFNGFEAPSDLRTALKDCHSETYHRDMDSEKIYSKLYNLNMYAYCRRYNSPLQMAPAKPTVKRLIGPMEYDGSRRIIKPEHYKILKILAFYNYQVEDYGAEFDSPLVTALTRLENVLCHLIVESSEEYAEYKWGEI